MTTVSVLSRSKIKRDLGKKMECESSIENNLNMFDMWSYEILLREESDEWKLNNMEYDLRSTDWILNKVRNSDVYAQNLYAAICNNEFKKNNKNWDASWRYAGGIIADMKEDGDYIDWYCSGIWKDDPLYVHESFITDEIRNDLKLLGWDIIELTDDDLISDFNTLDFFQNEQ